MTHPNFVTNGASLEDCHTNFFALADLCGIKWRRLYADSVLCFDPLDDPVLASYSKCLAADVLCVWQRVATRGHDHHRHNLQENNQLSYSKELWIFWYGEEPDLTGLIGSELTADTDQGSWESGLSYECRTLLFKALHNLIERCLLSRGFTRLGRWFVQPLDGAEKEASPQLAFAFNFFVHGESTVCASVDVRQRLAVCHLTKRHLSVAQNSHSGLKVILSPYGMAGVLTGQIFKETDLTTQRLLSEWHQFYPLRSRNLKDFLVEDESISAAVEVIVGGVKMRYPSGYVLVAENDETAASQVISGQNISTYGSCSAAGASHQKGTSLSGVLTPPTSPCDPSVTSGFHMNYKFLHNPSALNDNYQEGLHSLCAESQRQTACRIKQGSWQDSALLCSRNQQSSAAGNSEQIIGHWDFCDPAVLTGCNCSKCKGKDQSNSALPKSNISTSTSSIASSSPITSSSTANTTATISTNATSCARKSEKPEKSKTAHKNKGSIPFHKRNGVGETSVDYDNFVGSQTFNLSSSPGTPVLNNSSANLQFKGPNQSLRAATPSGLPQLHTSVVQPSSLGSPHPGTPTMDGMNSQLSSSEPAMPTLSPHPPLSKEEEGTVLESQDQGPSTHSPAAIPESSNNNNIKEKTTNEQGLLSPFQSTLTSLLENVKSEESPNSQTNSWTTGQQEETKPTPTSAVVLNTTNCVTSSVQTQLAPQGIKRPALVTHSHGDPHDELVMDGMLYDYTFLNGSIWESIPGKKRRISPINGAVKDGGNDMLSQYAYLKDNQMQIEENISSKPKDPYEFNDEFDEESPSSSSFRARIDIFVKEEEKPKDPSLSPAPDLQGVLHTQVVGAPPTPTQDPPKPNVTGEQQSDSSPPTPRNQASSFTSEKDLQVTDKDLENIFETSSSDDSADDLFQPPSTPTSNKLCGTPEESFPGKNCKNSSTSGILGVAELTRMFPTPPSLEHNTAPSPSGPFCGGDVNTMDTSDCYRDRSEILIDGGSSPFYEPVKDWSYVYKLPVQQKFVNSMRYASLGSSSNNFAVTATVQPEHIYKPSWQQSVMGSSGTMTTTIQNSHVTHVDRLIGNVNSQFSGAQMSESERIPPVFPVETPVDQRTLPMMSYELQSPASNASSYLNKHLNSIDSSSTASPIPEAHSLLVNLVIADSMLNLFKDHNFSSCTLCVCNMNTKGADAGIYLPSHLIPSGTDEPQYKCTCGFSAVVNRHQSHHSGIFYEDEIDVTGHHYESFFCRKSLLLVENNSKKTLGMEGNGLSLDEEIVTSVDHVPHLIMDLIRMQCSHLYTCFSLFHKAEQLRELDRICLQFNTLEISDGSEVCFLALDTGRQAVDNINNNKMDESLKSSCLHKWPYLAAKVPVSNLEVVRLLRSLQPVLQEAVQQRRHQKLWEVTYPVLGPLTWRQFHRLAGRGTEDQCEPQPIPSLLVGYDKDWLALSPFALKFWDKLLLEPYTSSRDVAYIVVAPDNDFILSHVKTYFKELSSVYELCKLGRHCPVTKVLRDGILRVGKTAAKNLADQPVDEWFNLIGDGPIASRLKLYAQACRYHLAPHLATQPLDNSLLESPSVSKPPEKPLSAASPRPASSGTETQDKEQSSNLKIADSESNLENPSGAEGVSSGLNSVIGVQDPWDHEDSQQIPTVVIYIVEPFTYGTVDNDVYRMATLGLLRSYTQMLQCLPEHIQNTIQLQVITLDSIMSLGQNDDAEKRKDQLKALAFSVFSQSHQLITHQSTVKSLTGFGPAAAQDMFLKNKDERNSGFWRISSKPFTLAPQKDKQTELGEMFGDRREKSSILFCNYCLTEDQRWLVASCTNDKGDMLETCCISIEVPNRTRRKKASVRKLALHKLLDFILEVLSKCLHSWRLVIGRIGRLGHGELKDWASLLSRKSLLRYSRQLRELCHQCAVLGPPDTPAILSACLVSLEPDSALRIMADQFTPDDRFSSSCNSCDLSTPEDASCTHILVFPTSATTQSSQATFQQEHIDPLAGTLGDDDIFQALNDDDIAVGQDINDIFRWTESPTQSPGASPRRDSISQPGSPSCGIGGRHSPFHHGGPNRGSGGLTVDAVEEPLQLLQQPLALGYYVSTAKTGPLPKWFWSACPQLQNVCPVFLKSALLIHSPSVQQSSDDLLHAPHIRNYHPLDSNLTTDVLRYVLEGYNSLSWLSLDPSTHDRRSCLPIHIQVLMQLYHAAEALI